MSQNIERKPEIQENSMLDDFLGDLINLDRGLPATVLGMLKSPGLVIESYFTDRGRFVNPFKYTIFILAVTTLIGSLFVDYELLMQQAAELGYSSSVEDANENFKRIEEESGLPIASFMTAMKDISVAMMTKFSQIFYILVMAPLMAFSSRLFFKKKREFFKHHYVMLLYMLATYAIFGLVFTPLMISEISFSIFTFLVTFVQLVFFMYVQIKYLELKGFDEYSMSFLSFFVGYILYMIATFIIQVGGGIILVMLRS
jgi:hypothetical protein